MQASRLDLTKARIAYAHAQEQYHQLDIMYLTGTATEDDCIMAFARMLDAGKRVDTLEKLEQEGNLI